MRHVIFVVPCYNEAKRLAVRDILRLLDGDPNTSLLFVDDGSRDGTGALLKQLADTHAPRIDAVLLPSNVGKAEAVRAGLNRALTRDPWAVGYADADFSTPPEELLRLARELDDPDVQVVLGSRVLLLGTHILRNPLRHYVGRMFATAAALALRLPVYDTQCGAKVFRVGPALCQALAQPFVSRWVFDVELLARLLAGPTPARLTPSDFREIPLRRWTEARGSKVRPWHAIGVMVALARIARDVRRARKPPGGAGRA